MHHGKIVQIIGPVVDVSFSDSNASLPAIFELLYTKLADGKKLGLEVYKHLGDNVVRAVALDSTEGLTRGMVVETTGKPISVPVGEKTLGRILNVLGEPIDDAGPVKSKDH